jgi:transcription termination/antitermination protein NusG
MSSTSQTYSIQPSVVPPANCENWYALHTRSRHERVVEHRLHQQGISTFCPIVSEVHRWSDRRKEVEVPLFSCYVFVRMAMTADERAKIYRAEGFLRFVGVRGQALPIPDEQIDAVRAITEQKVPWCSHPYLKVGQRIRIRGGALDGVEGIFLSRNGEDSLVVSVDAVQRSMAVRISGYDIEVV